MNGHSLKLHFCMFERSQRKSNSLDYHNFLQYFSLIAKFTCSKLDPTKKCFYMFKTLKPQKDIRFFQMSFLLPNVHHSL